MQQCRFPGLRHENANQVHMATYAPMSVFTKACAALASFDLYRIRLLCT